MNAERIKSLYSMRDILSRYGLPQPNRAGFIRCPFHKGDREPSMKIYEKDFHCFACQAHGDIFTFAQLMDGTSFKEAFLELGGSYEREGGESFSARLGIYRAQKKREAARKAQEELRRKRELNLLLMGACRKWLDRLEPLSDAWCETRRELQRQEYIWDLLHDPDECLEAAKSVRP